jgi:predicted Kef-type K+ transport protein
MELIWITSAYAAGLLASRLWLPPLVGYLLAGYALYMAGFRSQTLLSEFADIGILLLLFTVGLKLKLRSLFKREVFGVGTLHLLIVAGVSGLIFLLDHQRLSGGLVLGVSLAFSSTVLAVKVLEDNREVESFHGRTVMGILIFQDLVAVGLLAVVGGSKPSPWALGLLAFPLLRPVARWLFEATRNSELRLLLGILLAFSGGELAEAVGISKDLGALLMGVLLAGHPEVDDLGHKLWGLKEALLVAFFLQIGLLGTPTAEQLLMATGLLAVLPLQGWLFFTLMLLIGLRARTAFVAALALMTYSEFALIVAVPVIEDGLLEPEWKPVLGVAVAASLGLAALLNRNSHRLYTWVEPWLIRFERRVPHPDQIPADFGNAKWLVVGMGRSGRAAYKTLDRQRHKVMGLDSDPIRVGLLRDAGLRVAYGDIEDHALWEQASLNRLLGIVLALPDFRARQAALENIRGRGFAGTIGTTSFNVNEDLALFQSGADVVFHPLTEAGERLAERVLEIQSSTAS